MPLSIKNPRAEQLAAEVARVTGETLTDAVILALEERLERLRGRRTAPDLLARLTAISQRCARLPDSDSRTPDEILGYDAAGTFEGAS
jgi:antitoxin VapB